MSITLLKNALVYAPEALGRNDILIVGEKIARVAPRIEGYEGLPEVTVVDLSGRTAVSGYIDLHEHLTGGGGEQGPASRVPELNLSELIRSGVTTVLGLLGTDGVTRSVENLLAKTQSFNQLGVTALMLTGAYGYPSPTLTGSVERDVTLISECVGVKIAVSDHRDSAPGVRELADAATQARRGGLLGGCAGLTVMHMGGGDGGLGPVFRMLEETDVPIRNLLPTHMGRSSRLLWEGREFIRRGGTIDITCSSSPESTRSARLLADLWREGTDISHVTTSSDGCGSMPRFDEAGNCVGLTYASPLGLHRQMRALILNEGMPVTDALRFQTVNPAAVLGLAGIKGCIAPGADADITVWDDDLRITDVFARGKTAMRDGIVIMKGRFEE